MFDAISFPGGGNRCYWQGGFFEALAERFDLAPSLAVGVSAGAFAGMYSLLGLGPQVRALVFAGCGPHLKNMDIAGWRRTRMSSLPDTAFITLAPDWICEVISASTEAVDADTNGTKPATPADATGGKPAVPAQSVRPRYGH